MRSTPGKLSHCSTLRLASPLEVRHGSYPSPLLRDRHSQRIGGCVSPVAGGPAGEDRGATLRHYDRRIAPASRMAVAPGVDPPGDGVPERGPATGPQPPRWEL